MVSSSPREGRARDEGFPALPWWASGPHYECQDDWLTTCIQIDGGSVAQVIPGPHVEGGRTAARASI